MGRLFDAASAGKNPMNIPAPVIARYAEDKGSRQLMLTLLKEWVTDTSCATISYNEHHIAISDTYSSKEYAWLTRLELDLKYSSLTNPDGKKFVDFIVKNSKSFPHPDYPKRKEWRQYRVLGKLLEGTNRVARMKTDVHAQGQISDSASASILLANHEHTAALVGKVDDDPVEQEAGTNGANRKRERKELTPEQQAAKDKADQLRTNLTSIRKIQKEVDVWKLKISASKQKLKQIGALPDAGSGVQWQINVLEEFEPRLKDVFELANGIKFEHRFDDTGGCQTQLRDIVKNLRTELQVADARIHKMGSNKVNPKEEPGSPNSDGEEAAKGGSQAY